MLNVILRHNLNVSFLRQSNTFFLGNLNTLSNKHASDILLDQLRKTVIETVIIVNTIRTKQQVTHTLYANQINGKSSMKSIDIFLLYYGKKWNF